jgi:hypothetical protein
MTPAERAYTQHFRRENPERPILECYWSARRHIHFMATMKRDLALTAKRSRAAKKAWKTRKAMNQ